MMQMHQFVARCIGLLSPAWEVWAPLASARSHPLLIASPAHTCENPRGLAGGTNRWRSLCRKRGRSGPKSTDPIRRHTEPVRQRTREGKMRILLIVVTLFFVVAVAGSCGDSGDSEIATRGGKPVKSGDQGGGGKSQTVWYADNDRDGFGDPKVSQTARRQPTGYVANNEDCDDAHASVNLRAVEVCDGLDNNCNGIVDDMSPGAGGGRCCGGEWTDISADASNCGGCNQACPEGHRCVNGVCEAQMESCDASETGKRRCTGDVIEECTGTFWEPVTNCADQGMTCAGVASGEVACQEVGGGGHDSYEQNDSYSSAYSLGGTTDCDDQQVVVTANFHSNDDEDWYKVHVEDTFSCTLDPKVSIEMPTGHSYEVVLHFYCDGSSERFGQRQTVEQSTVVALEVPGCSGGFTGGEDSGDLYIQVIPLVRNSDGDYVLRING